MFGSTSGNLREVITDPDSLKRLAFEEFFHARQTSRLIAFTGSYCNVHLGYMSWHALMMEYHKKNSAGSNKALKKLLDTIGPHRALQNEDPSKIDLLEFLTNGERLFNPSRYEKNRKKILKEFRLTLTPSILNIENFPDINKVLFQEVKVSRAMTLNYDMELEWASFVSDHDCKGLMGESRDTIWKALTKEGSSKPYPITEKNKTLKRNVPGLSVSVSDIMSREEPEKIYEFLLNANHNEQQIFHLHGRQDSPLTMLLSKRDYRDLYWRRGYNKMPFEYAQQAMFAGNSILFVGLGLSEADVMKNLEQFRSDNPSRVQSPHFVVWESYLNEDKTEVNQEQNDILRLYWYRRFGVHVLFDTEMVEISHDFEINEDEDRAQSYESFCKSKVSHYLDEIRTNSEIIAKKLIQQVSKNDIRKILGPKHKLSNQSELSKVIERAMRITIPLTYLSNFCYDRWVAFDWQKEYFWSPQDKYDSYSNWGGNKPLELWGLKREPNKINKKFAFDVRPRDSDIESPDKRDSDTEGPDEKIKRAFDQNYLQIHIGEPASGKGTFASDLAYHLKKTHIGENVVLLNGPFANETDSLFAILSGASNNFTAWHDRKSRLQSSEDTLVDNFEEHGGELSFRSKEVMPLSVIRSSKTTLIINGMERFIRHDGKPLSLELDILIRRCVRYFEGQRALGKPPVNFSLIMIGTKRLKRYIDALNSDYGLIKKVELIEKGNGVTKKAFELKFTKVNSLKEPLFTEDLVSYNPSSGGLSYFESIKKTLYNSRKNWIKKTGGKSPKEWILDSQDNTDAKTRRQHFYKQVLNPDNLSRLSYPDGWSKIKTNLDPNKIIELLSVMAFIGQPTNPKALCQVKQLPNGQELNDLFQWLEAHNLVFRIQPNILLGDKRSADNDRFGLHKSLLAEMLERNGIPVSPSDLATGFNLSLCIAQTNAGYAPSLDGFEKLGSLTDSLIESYKGCKLIPYNKTNTKQKIEKLRCKLQGFGHHNYSTVDVRRMINRNSDYGIKAALSIIRGYFSTATLLMHNYSEIDPRKTLPQLNRHAFRIERLLRVARDTAFLQHSDTNMTGDSNVLGKNALSPDDLVWLYNELGVVYLTQGKLYRAQRALKKAEYYNTKFVEFGDRLQNWRRISLNLVQLKIERGQVKGALELIRDIETSIDENGIRFGLPLQTINVLRRDGQTVREKIVNRYGNDSEQANLHKVDPDFAEDLILTTGLCLGFQGICHVLQGSYVLARESYLDSISILKFLGESRAYSWFQNHMGSASYALGDYDNVFKCLERAVSAARTSQQSDVNFHARIAYAWWSNLPIYKSKIDNENQRMPQLLEALKYAKNNEMRILQSEVLQLLAQIYFTNQDYDSALKFASDGVAVAAKHGHGLRKVRLRILLAQIFAARGNEASAMTILSSAFNVATSIKFAKAVKEIDNIKLTLVKTGRKIST